MTEPNDDDERTMWCGNLNDKVTEELLYELFLQVCHSYGIEAGCGMQDACLSWKVMESGLGPGKSTKWLQHV